jgi:hypothetical protein
MRWRAIAFLSLLGALLAGCLGTLTADPDAEAITLVPEDELDLPAHGGYRNWLLRGERGWCGAHETRFGGDPDDPGVATVRAVVFRTMEDARHGHDRLTPGYLHAVLRGRMVDAPEPFDYPEPLPGDAARTFLYDVRLPLVYAPDQGIPGQLTTVRAGRVVLLIESIGVHPPQLVPAIREMVRAANRLTAEDGC